jgi:hypothetical protein
LTRRIRSFTGHHHFSLDRHELVLLTVQIPDGFLEQRLELAVLSRDAGDRQSCSLPELVMVDLGHGRAETVLQIRFRGLHVLALAFQRARFREVQLDRQYSDVARAHGRDVR